MPPGQLEPSPWDAIPADGRDLTVDAFLTTLMSQAISGLRRQVTLPYARRFGLSVPEWRLLALVAHGQRLPFAGLVAQSTSDKALVSRTLRLLESRGLVSIQAEGKGARKRLSIAITAAGLALHARVIPVARQRQAEMLRRLSPDQRQAMYHGLQTLIAACRPGGDGDEGRGDDGRGDKGRDDDDSGDSGRGGAGGN